MFNNFARSHCIARAVCDKPRVRGYHVIVAAGHRSLHLRAWIRAISEIGVRGWLCVLLRCGY